MLWKEGALEIRRSVEATAASCSDDGRGRSSSGAAHEAHYQGNPPRQADSDNPENGLPCSPRQIFFGSQMGAGSSWFPCFFGQSVDPGFCRQGNCGGNCRGTAGKLQGRGGGRAGRAGARGQGLGVRGQGEGRNGNTFLVRGGHGEHLFVHEGPLRVTKNTFLIHGGHGGTATPFCPRSYAKGREEHL